MSFQAGYDKGVTWTPDTGGGGAINITGWDAEDGGDTPEITHTGVGEIGQAFLAGIPRCPGQVSLNYDTANTPANMGIRFGAKGTFVFDNGGPGNSVHVIIQKVSHKSVVNGVVSLTITVASDSIKADGSTASAPTFA